MRLLDLAFEISQSRVRKNDTGHDTGGASSGSASSGDVSDLARRVIAGEFGNRDERNRRLGSYYSIVQRRVNELLA